MSSPSAPPPLTTWQLVKMTGPIILFGILLPFVDNVTDLRMIIRLYSGIPDCKYIDPEEYLAKNGTHWQDLYTCLKSDLDNFCKLNPDSKGCDSFHRTGYPEDITSCELDQRTCMEGPATFCEDKPGHPNCGHYNHPHIATMFLGISIFFNNP